jgi:hypothetical protein
MIGAIAFILLDANAFPTLDSKLIPLGTAVGSGIIGTVSLLAIAQLIDLLMALEMNTRATTAMIQRMGRVMKDRL